MKNKKKILYIINHKTFFVSHRLKIALEAQKIDFKTFLVCGNDASSSMKKESERILKKKKINFKEFELDPSKFDFIKDLKFICKTYLLIKKYNPNIIHLASPKSIILGGIAAYIYNRSSIILSISGMGYLFTDKNLKKKILSYLFVKIIKIIISNKKNILIVQNKHDYIFFKNKLNINKKKIYLINGSGVNINKFFPTKKKKKKLILFPGRLLLNKGIVEFVESAKIINKKYKNWKFVIAGAADYKSPVMLSKNKLNEILNTNYISYLGHVTHNKMHKLLSQVSIMCLPSYREGMPMALQEGAASGLPIVTSNVIGCNSAIINNKTGFLVKSKNTRQLSKKLITLINSLNLRKKFGLAARKFAIKNFDEKKIIKDNLNIYVKLTTNEK